jgi:hypothetical protein
VPGGPLNRLRTRGSAASPSACASARVSSWDCRGRPPPLGAGGGGTLPCGTNLDMCTKLCLLAVLLSCISQESRSFLFPGSPTIYLPSPSLSMSLRISRRPSFGVSCLHSESLQCTNTLERLKEDVQVEGSEKSMQVTCKNIQHENAGSSLEPHALDVVARDKHRLRVWYKSPEYSESAGSPPVCLLLHGRTWSSIPV